MVDTLATAMGFELPDYADTNIYTDVTGGIEGIGDEADDSTDSVNKLKKALASIDEMSILSEGKTKGIKLDTGSGYSELDNAINEKTQSYMQKFNEELGNMSNKAKELADKIQPALENFFKKMDELSPLFIGVATSIGAYKIMEFFVGLATKIGSLALTPTGVIALAIGGIAAIYLAIKEYNKKLMQEDLASRFGDIQLKLKDIEEIANTITTKNILLISMYM
jgi:hypothetical protein